MARQQRVLTQDDFSFSGVVVTKKGRGKAAKLTFVDKSGNEIDRQQALRREYSAKYRNDNPDAAKKSSRDYAAGVREDAKKFREMMESANDSDIGPLNEDGDEDADSIEA